MYLLLSFSKRRNQQSQQKNLYLTIKKKKRKEKRRKEKEKLGPAINCIICTPSHKNTSFICNLSFRNFRQRKKAQERKKSVPDNKYGERKRK